jgi:uncharacterized SAM-binding protein YcdF (DUF218 family)
MFFFKKLVTPLFLPFTLSLLILLAGLLLLWFSRRQKTGKVLVTLAFVTLAVLGYPDLTRPALMELERTYVPIAAVPQGVKWVVVLGGGASADAGLPMHERAGDATRTRVLEGVRLHRLAPGTRLLLSGGGSGAETRAMRAVAESLGVAAASLVIDPDSQDTETQARRIKALVGADPCVLVTSASHMRRALGLFRKAGVNSTPAPTHFIAQTGPWYAGNLWPGIEGIAFAERLAYEYLGMAWAKLRGLI